MQIFVDLSQAGSRIVRAADEQPACLIGELAETRKNGRANRLSGRLRAALSFSQIDEIMGAGLRPYLNDIKRQCAQIHTALYQQYVSYPIEAALRSDGKQANQ